ncbi:MAG: HAMP domain-containing histidine kinase [Comamonadaceae bacterium]|nr:MAG: HAMP domain-containing histidine kinase [Comamonadaceae bacterium]
MKLHLFLTTHMEEILTEWAAFAQTQQPAALGMTKLALNDHARAMLQAIALDVETSQNADQQYQKSRGMAPPPAGRESAASIHGGLRQASDFSLLQLSAEFRALRATVLRLWLPRVSTMSASTAYEMVRFNEAIDQALAESVVTYSAHADHTRELFLAVLGHDLRSPLSTMALAGEALVRDGLTPRQLADTGARVRRSARLMKSMVDDLLGYTSTQFGTRMPVTLKQADVAQVCASALEDAGATYPQSRFQIRTTGDLVGSFDSVRLHQLFANLLINAAQYGAPERPVLLEAQGAADAVTVQVTNFGQAIPADSLAAIFKPLVQLPAEGEDDSRPRTSLGLGLFIAREIAEAHGGHLAVQSDAVDGTVFTVRLPRPQPVH